MSFVLAWLTAAALPWSPIDEAELGPVRTLLGFSEGLRPLSVGRLPDDWGDPAYCGSCHAEVYEGWKLSRHAVSATNEIFLAGFALEPKLRCVRCHAPLAEQTRSFLRATRASYVGRENDSDLAKDATLPTRSSSLPRRSSSLPMRSANLPTRTPNLPTRASYGSEEFGISCAVCHVRDGVILTSRLIDTPEHPTRFEPLLLDSRFCGSCHQFRFERQIHNPGQNATGKVPVLTEHVVQDTWREAQQRGLGECRDCHMATFGHRMPGAHDARFAASALRISARPLDARRHLVELAAVGTGHRFPSGDLLRHMTLEVRRNGEWQVAAVFGREFEVVEDREGPFKREVVNTTLEPGTVRRVIVPATGTLAWRVRYAFTSSSNILRGSLPETLLRFVVSDGLSPAFARSHGR